MNNPVTRASLFLIAAEASFIHALRDQNITLEFCFEQESLHTRKFTSNGDMLVYDFESHSLIWRSNKMPGISISLDNHQDYQIVRWIETQAIEAQIPMALNFGYATEENPEVRELLFTVGDVYQSFKMTDKLNSVQLQIECALSQIEVAC